MEWLNTIEAFQENELKEIQKKGKEIHTYGVKQVVDDKETKEAALKEIEKNQFDKRDL